MITIILQFRSVDFSRRGDEVCDGGRYYELWFVKMKLPLNAWWSVVVMMPSICIRYVRGLGTEILEQFRTRDMKSRSADRRSIPDPGDRRSGTRNPI